MQNFILVLALVMAFLAALKVSEPPHLSYGWFSVFLVIGSTLVPLFK